MKYPAQTSTEHAELRVPKASGLVADHLRRQIIGSLAEGEPLPSEFDLLSEFRVSRPTLREAYRILEAEGLISVKRGIGGGARAHKPTPHSTARYLAAVLQSQSTALRDVFEARVLLESPAARIVASHPGTRSAEVLEAINTDAAMHANQLDEQLADHRRFHETLLQLAGNRTLLTLIAMIDVMLDALDFEVYKGRVAAVSMTATIRSCAQRDHVELVRLIEKRSPEEADRLWRRHLDEAAEFVLPQIDLAATLSHDKLGG